MAVNLKGPFLCAKAAHAHMRERGGSIVNVASATVMSGFADVDALCRLQRRRDRDDARDGARTRNAEHQRECAGAGIHADGGQPRHDGERATYGVERGAIKRAATPEDMVGAALWLASPLVDFMTGQTLVVDGGRQFL